MSFCRSFRQLASPTGLAASVSLSMMIVAAGCGDGTSSTDKATVVVNDPASDSSPAPATAPANAPATEAAKTSEPAPAAAAPSSAGGFGTLKGRVVFEGDVPAPKILLAKGDKEAKDAAFCAKEEIDSERLIVNKTNKGVRNAIVYIPKPTAVKPESAAAAKAAQIEFDQKNCRFIPHVLAAMKGSTVIIKSSDSVGHNAHALELPNNPFNLPTQPLSSIPYPLKLADKPGKVGCDIHPWMEAYWLVLDNPYFAVTDADGNFEIKDAPAGDQKVVVWAESLGKPGYLTAPSGDVVSIKANGETAKEFKLEASRVK